MPKDNRNTLKILNAELDFVKKGGYAQVAGDPWQTKLALEDSQACMNSTHKNNPAPCSKCLLMQFVPPNKRAERVPCRHIPMTSSGDTLLHLYRGATQEEIENTLANWLKETIAKLQSEESPTLH